MNELKKNISYAGLTYFPIFFSKKSILLYVFTFLTCSVLFINQTLPIHWIAFGLVEVIGFFHLSNLYSKRWKIISENEFRKKIFGAALALRIVYVVFSYFFYKLMTGTYFEFKTGDAFGYHNEAIWIIQLFQSGQFSSVYIPYISGNYSDAGYPIYLSFVYYFLDDSIFLARIIKAILSAYTCILIYRVAKNNFGDSTGRVAAIFALFFPSFIYYCGLHVKETEMIFVVSLFIERVDSFMRDTKMDYKKMILILALAFSLFFFRTVLGVTALFALFSVLLFTNKRIARSMKRVAIAFWLIVASIIFLGGTLHNEISRYWEKRDSNQKISMIARSKIEKGNKLAKYGQSAIFAPFMFIAPFPTMVNVETQQNQMLLHGGFFVKNILAFFVLFSFWFMYKRKIYKSHMLILTFIVLYLGILALSKFAISERFHMPAYPVFIILAALGVTNINLKVSKLFVPYLILMALIIIGWNWFKLAGRA